MATTTKSRRGEGMLYRRGTTWWLKYYQDGNMVRESSGSDDERVARRLLREKTARIALHEPLVARSARVSYPELRSDLLAHYQATGTRDVEKTGWRLKHLDPAFSRYRAIQITPEAINRYVVARQGAGAANATINRELETLSRMLRLAHERHKLARIPVIHRLKPAAPRAGFFEHEQFEAVRKHLPVDLQAAITIAYTYGWRNREILGLQLRQLDLGEGTLRLGPGETKNDEPRVVYLTPELATLLTEQVARVHALSRDLGQIVPHLFPHLPGPHVRRPELLGKQRDDFRRAWATAVRRAGLPGMLRHDFRRTAVRNMEQSGVPRSVAMKLTGHKTEAVNRRYAIVSSSDLRRAATLIADGHNSGTTALVVPIAAKGKAPVAST
jgi:integrase